MSSRPANAPFKLALVLVFFLSGATGLVYELVWTRVLRLIVGSTTLSLTIVLAAFMAGLALGAWLAGKRADAVDRPLRVYGALELLIGAWGVALPFLARAVEPAIGVLYRLLADRPVLLALAELALLAPVLLPGSALMGATLPVLGRAIARDDVARSGGTLYASNTLGAALGAGIAGFLLLPAVGILWSTIVAAATNAAIAALVLALDRRAEPALAPASAPEAEEKGKPLHAELAVAISAIAGMSLQIVWTRLFVTSVGSSTYAFTGVVTVYILGIGIGAAAGSRLAGLASPARLLAGAALLGGAAAALTAPFFAWLPERVAFIVVEQKGEIRAVLAREVMFAALGLLPATALMGAVFPFAVALAGGAPDRPGRALARVSSASSLGAIAGALVGGLVLLPLLGLAGSLRASSLLAGAVGLVALAADPAPRVARARLAIVLGLPLVLAVIVAPSPDPRLLDGGAYIYGMRNVLRAQSTGASATELLRRGEKIVKRAEGEDLIAAIYELRCDQILVINGKVDASSQADSESQLLVGHLPILLHGPGARRVCVVGLGSGMTAGAAITHPGLEKLDLIEISPTVARLVTETKLFDLLSRGALHDARTRLLIADGRAHITHSRDLYDVVISQPTNPWIAGVGDLFTREYFERARDRLAEGGVFGQWLQGYSTSQEAFTAILRTFQDVFPGAQLWRFGQGFDFLLVGTREGTEPQLSLESVRHALASSEPLRASLIEAGISEPLSTAWYYSLDAAAIKKLAGEGPRNTDDSGWLEFHAPFHLFSDWWPLDGDEGRALEDGSRWPFPDAKPRDLERIRKARDLYLEACRIRGVPAHLLPRALPLSEKLLRKALESGPPADGLLRSELGRVLSDRIRIGQLADPDDLARAVEEIGRAHTTIPQVLAVYARAAWKTKRYDDAERAYRRLVALRPTWDHGRALLATILLRRRGYQESVDILEAATTDDLAVLSARGAALAGLERNKEARDAIDRAIALAPEHERPDVDVFERELGREWLEHAWTTSGLLRVRANDLRSARDDFAKAVAADPLAAEAWFNLAFADFKLGDFGDATTEVDQVLRLDPENPRAHQLIEKLTEKANGPRR